MLNVQLLPDRISRTRLPDRRETEVQRIFNDKIRTIGVSKAVG